MTIKCGNCQNYHQNVCEVKQCFADNSPYAERDPFAALEGDAGWSNGAMREIQPEEILENAGFHEAREQEAWEARMGAVSYEQARDEAAATRNFASREQIRQGRQRVPLSEKQRNFILSLSAERIEGWSGSFNEVKDVEALSKSEASARITALLALPKIAPRASYDKSVNGGPGDAPIPDGHYALADEDGQVRFYSVKAGKNRWEGYTFIKGLIGSPGNWTEIKLGRSEREAIAAKIGADWLASARLYGEKFTRCSFCESPLSDPRSRAALYGETCAGNHGLPYPSLREALATLGESV